MGTEVCILQVYLCHKVVLKRNILQALDVLELEVRCVQVRIEILYNGAPDLLPSPAFAGDPKSLPVRSVSESLTD